LIRY